MTLKKLAGKIHLWLGLGSGLIVFMVAITGCLYAFQAEIQEATEPFRFVKPQQQPVLPPSQLGRIADSVMPGKHITALLYGKPGTAAQAMYWKYEAYYDLVFLDPYTGAVQQVKDMKHSFFPWILEGHEFLWLPEKIGRPIVATATLLFAALLISGLYLWWPRNKNGRRQRFSIKWNARWRRRNYDLHNVLGFYILTVGLILAITGLVFGFEWFAKGAYYGLTGGKEMVPYFDMGSDTTAISEHTIPPVDQVYLHMRKAFPQAENIQLYYPQNEASAIDANANPDASTYWKVDYTYWDQHTLNEIPSRHLWKRFREANAGDMLMRMAYDIHIGAIWGLWGKVLVFCTSLVVASLPVTGFLIWWGRRNKHKKKGTRKWSLRLRRKHIKEKVEKA
ncbi:PepSY-associated TM helix domain-containing protein [Filimonas effusa]|uniref:PepSY domain-containing protein n=1 Tax=Filimonas effusa TaxID=2508721 RepID=A0A4Q1D779_9BACT|nr:PepSY-associated TM helix domain-containing protein [Filimonas effusa]RXK83591.1 PepSY domain-containing protein [Filimonas effusa]